MRFLNRPMYDMSARQTQRRMRMYQATATAVEGTDPGTGDPNGEWTVTAKAVDLDGTLAPVEETFDCIATAPEASPPIVSGDRFTIVLTNDGKRVPFRESPGGAATSILITPVYWSYDADEYIRCIPQFTAGSFWYIHEIAAPGTYVGQAANEWWIGMKEMCVGLWDQPGFCLYTGSVELDDGTGTAVALDIVDGVIQYGGDNYNGTISVVDPADGSQRTVTIADGLANVEGVYNMLDTATGGTVRVRFTSDGKVGGQ